jgi:hypothetical protein
MEVLDQPFEKMGAQFSMPDSAVGFEGRKRTSPWLIAVANLDGQTYRSGILDF